MLPCVERNGKIVGTGSGRGFTLIELFMVIAVIATLIGILLPAMSGAKETTWRANA